MAVSIKYFKTNVNEVYNLGKQLQIRLEDMRRLLNFGQNKTFSITLLVHNRVENKCIT